MPVTISTNVTHNRKFKATLRLKLISKCKLLERMRKRERVHVCVRVVKLESIPRDGTERKAMGRWISKGDECFHWSDRFAVGRQIEESARVEGNNATVRGSLVAEEVG
jgi:hypothetical protein